MIYTALDHDGIDDAGLAAAIDAGDASIWAGVVLRDEPQLERLRALTERGLAGVILQRATCAEALDPALVFATA